MKKIFLFLMIFLLCYISCDNDNKNNDKPLPCGIVIKKYVVKITAESEYAGSISIHEFNDAKQLTNLTQFSFEASKNKEFIFDFESIKKRYYVSVWKKGNDEYMLKLELYYREIEDGEINEQIVTTRYTTVYDDLIHVDSSFYE